MTKFFFSLKSYIGVSRMSKCYFNEVSRMSHASFKDRKFQGCFKKISGMVQEILKGVLREY